MFTFAECNSSALWWKSENTIEHKLVFIGFIYAFTKGSVQSVQQLIDEEVVLSL